jgi:filamentous hemagglutinin
MVTAGLTNAELIDVGGKTLSLNQIAGISSIPGAGSVAQGSWNTFGQNLLGIAGRGLVTAGVSTAIQGGSFGDALRDSVVGDLAAMGAGAIGAQWGSGPNKNVALQTLAHAGLGCAAAAARDKDCAAGALGGAAESVLGNLITLPTGENGGYSTGTRALYTVGAMFAADVLSDAVVVDSATAKNAALNNFLSTKQNEELERLRQKYRREGFLNGEDAARHVFLTQKDQASNMLLDRHLADPRSLSAMERETLSALVYEYAGSDPMKATALLAPVDPRGSLKPVNFLDPAWQQAQAARSSFWGNVFGAGRTLSEDEQIYRYAVSQMALADHHHQWAEVGTPALFFIANPIGTLVQLSGIAAGSFQIRQGLGALIEENYTEGVANVVGGILMVGPVRGVGKGAALSLEATEPIVVSGARAIDRVRAYQSGVQSIYNNAAFADRQYTAVVNGRRVNGVADDVIIVGDKRTAIEAKYVDDWSTSIRNPASPSGSRPWAEAERRNVLTQAAKYSAGFDGGVVYHTNSLEFAGYCTKIFGDAGIANFRFVITPVTK